MLKLSQPRASSAVMAPPGRLNAAAAADFAPLPGAEEEGDVAAASASSASLADVLKPCVRKPPYSA